MSRAFDLRVAQASPLAAYALRGLDNCWLPERRRWSHCYHLDGRAQPNESIPESDVFYSLNVLLGMSRLPQALRVRQPLADIFRECAEQLLVLPVRKYAYGMALWSGAELGYALPSAVEDHIYRFAADPANWTGLHAQDIGMLITGIAAQIRAGNTRGRDTLRAMLDLLVERYACASDLFYDTAEGWRRDFASFATQTYLTLACYNAHDVLGDARALSLATACTRKLIGLQGPQGEWPWFYHTPSGRVVDFYEVYSVHQDGMAPAFLEHAERHGVPGARKALIDGFAWIFGANQLGHSMLRPEVGMIVRSIARRGELDSKAPRVLRSTFNAFVGATGSLIEPAKLTLRLECRSYHLGWVLWSFAARQDVPEITHAAALSAPGSAREPRGNVVAI